ncbi:MAG: FecR domain-containing protein [Rhodospirillales bacterium]|nr:FecR domain-containing protein [Rhodospirillales bacterium]
MDARKGTVLNARTLMAATVGVMLIVASPALGQRADESDSANDGDGTLVSGIRPEAVGQATLVVRSVFGTVDDKRLPVTVHDAVFWHELIETADESAAQMVFLDGTTLSSGPNSRVVIDEFVYAGGGEARRFAVSVVRGLMRFVTGTSPSDIYEIRTPNAMIGVRGTDIAINVDDAGNTDVYVRHGRISLTSTSGFTVPVRAGQASRVTPGGGVAPEPPAMPSRELIAETIKVSALLSISGEGDQSTAFSIGEAAAVRANRGEANTSRLSTTVKSSGADCSGC